MRLLIPLSLLISLCKGASLVQNIEKFQKGLETANEIMEKGSKIAEGVSQVAALLKKDKGKPEKKASKGKDKEDEAEEEEEEERKRKKKRQRQKEEDEREEKEQEERRAKVKAAAVVSPVVPVAYPVQYQQPQPQTQPPQPQVIRQYINTPDGLPPGFQDPSFDDPTQDPNFSSQPIRPILDFKKGALKAVGDVAVGQAPVRIEKVPGGLLITQETYQPRDPTDSISAKAEDLAMMALKQRILLLEHSLEREKTESKLLIQRLNGIDGLTEDQRYNELRRLRVQQESMKSDVHQMKSFFNQKDDA